MQVPGSRKPAQRAARVTRDAVDSGFGDGFAKAVELVLTPTIFAAIGYGLDRVFGIVPVLTIVLGVFGLVGSFVSTWYRYDHEMKGLERRRAERTTTRPSGTASSLAPSPESGGVAP